MPGGIMPGGGGGGGTPPNPPLLVGGAIPGGGNMPYTFIRFEQKEIVMGKLEMYTMKTIVVNKHRKISLQGAMSCLGAEEGEAAAPSREAAFLL